MIRITLETFTARSAALAFAYQENKNMNDKYMYILKSRLTISKYDVSSDQKKKKKNE